MNSPTIEMERSAAVQKLDAYERAARGNPKHYHEIDKGVMLGYRVLARGGRLVDVNEALRHGGLNLAGIPKLAIARAHVLRVAWRPFHWERPAGLCGIFEWSNRNQRIASHLWGVPEGTFDAQIQRKDFSAMTPLVPLPLRPKHKLDNYFILWEANWNPEPPKDPYLLRPLAGSLMEIIAEWDLTLLEIAAVRNSVTR